MEKESRPFIIALAILAVMLLQATFCTAGVKRVIKLKELKDKEEIIQVTGVGIYPNSTNFSTAQKKRMAERAAVVDGYRKLLEQIGGVIVNSKTTMHDYMVINDTVQVKVSGIVRGAKQIATRHFEEGSVEVDLEITLGNSFYHSFESYINTEDTHPDKTQHY